MRRQLSVCVIVLALVVGSRADPPKMLTKEQAQALCWDAFLAGMVDNARDYNRCMVAAQDNPQERIECTSRAWVRREKLYGDLVACLLRALLRVFGIN